ncbi:MAG: hypothetical protein K2M08_02540 [Anaeroplasmataceae bacterium]|nr:hypothetical protein [Anaeroplasmataceae bacterium]
MNEVVFKIYTDIFMGNLKLKKIKVNETIDNSTSLCFSKKEAILVIEKMMKDKGRVIESTDISENCVYLRFSIYRQLENSEDEELEVEINQTVYDKYIELFNPNYYNL